MINNPNPSNGLQHHRVHDTLLGDPDGLLRVYVGSWPTEDTSGRPALIKELTAMFTPWSPDYFNALDEIVNEHPEWTGLPPFRPNANCRFNWQSKTWEDPRTLADLKAQQWTQIKQSRSAAEYAGFTWDGSTFDSDAISQQRITGAVTMAQLNPAFEIDWTLADNTIRTLSAPDMISVGLALGVHVATVFAKGQALRAQIEAAATREEVESIVW